MPPGTDSFTLDVGEVGIHCSFNQVPGRPLLLVNGLGGNVEMWSPLRDALSHRPTLAVDLPGTGRSATPLLPLGIGQLANVLVRVLDRLGIESIDLLGYSLGGAVAQVLARREPTRVRSLVLAASTAGWGAFTFSPAAFIELAGLAPFLGTSTPEATARAFGDPPGQPFANFTRARLMVPPTAMGYAFQMLAIAGWSSHGWLDEIGQPTLVLAGALDRAAPLPNSEALARRIPRARLEIIPHAGHLFLLRDDVEAVASIIDDFLESAHACSS